MDGHDSDLFAEVAAPLPYSNFEVSPSYNAVRVQKEKSRWNPVRAAFRLARFEAFRNEMGSTFSAAISA